MRKDILFVIVPILFIVTICSSCKKDWLDVKTNLNLEVPSTLNDYQAIMDDADNVMNALSQSMQEIASDDHSIADALYNSYLTSSPWIAGAYTGTLQPSTTTCLDWYYSYHAISNCNLVLEGLSKVKNSNKDDETVKSDIIGQALFQRSRFFFEIAQCWAPPFDSATSVSDLGIPLRLTADINDKSVRSTVKETYNQIIEDLLMARDLLPRTGIYKTRASVNTVYALLARIYLSMGEYSKAGLYADSSLNIYNTLIDYNSLDATASFPIPLLNQEVVFHNFLFGNGITSASYQIDTALYNLYDSNDLRKTIFFTLVGGSIRFKGYYTGKRVVFGGIATDELYLIRAECNARAGNLDLAMDDLNTLLKTRWVTDKYIPLLAASADDALAMILVERKKELLTRGVRWSDLRRLNKDPQFSITITRSVLGNIYTIEPNSYKYTFPIPQDIIQKTGMQQNIGW